MIGTGAKPAQRQIVDPMASTQELDRGTYVVKGSRRKHLIVRPAGPGAAIAQAAQIHAQHEIPAPGPASCERDVYSVGSHMIGGTCIEENDGASTHLAR